MIKDCKICGIVDINTLKFIVNHQNPPKFVGFVCNYKKRLILGTLLHCRFLRVGSKKCFGNTKTLLHTERMYCSSNCFIYLDTYVKLFYKEYKRTHICSEIKNS